MYYMPMTVFIDFLLVRLVFFSPVLKAFQGVEITQARAEASSANLFT
jgi:hypothetical protein